MILCDAETSLKSVIKIVVVSLFYVLPLSCEPDLQDLNDIDFTDHISKPRFSTDCLFGLSSFGVSSFSSSAQGMDIYEDKVMFQAGLPGNLIYILDLDSHTCLGTISFEAPFGERSHMNNINCGGKYINTDRWPLLYVSQTTSSHSCFVLHLSDDAFDYELVQTIKYIGTQHHANSNYDWFVDINKGYIYTYGKRNGVLEDREIVKFPLPSNDVFEVVLTDEDVLDSFMLEKMSIYQGSKIINGFLFAPVGYGNWEYPGYLKVIDLDNQKLVESISIKCGEPESIGKYKNGAIICGGGKNPFYYYLYM